MMLTVHADACAVPVTIADLAATRGCVQATVKLHLYSWRQLAAYFPRLPDTPRSCAGSRQLLAAQVAPAGPPAVDSAALAPGPAAPAPLADVLFTLTAPSAELSADALVLRDVAPVVQSFTRKAQTGVYRTGAIKAPADRQLGCVARSARSAAHKSTQQQCRLGPSHDQGQSQEQHRKVAEKVTSMRVRRAAVGAIRGKAGYHCQQSQSYSRADAAVRCAADFANGSAGGRFVNHYGFWLDRPYAVVRAMSGEQAVSALVALRSPHYNASTSTLTFEVRGGSPVLLHAYSEVHG